jgi:hypothetical protein
VSVFDREQMVEWRGQTCTVVERLPEGKSRIRDAEGNARVILDSFLAPIGEVIACTKHGVNERTAPRYHEIHRIKQNPTKGDYSELIKVTPEEIGWYLKATDCGTCRVVVARAVCHCGRVKNTEGNCENVACAFPEAQQPIRREEDEEITVMK